MNRYWFCLSGLLLAVLLFGCAGKSSSDSNEMVLYTAHGAKIHGLDPGDIGDQTSAAYASQIYETLYDYHYLKRPYELIPQLAAEMPLISQDGLTYTIHLRNDVYFQPDKCFGKNQKRRLTAHDFVYAWKRIADIKYISKNWWVFDGRIKGLDEFREYTKTVQKGQTVDYNLPVEGLHTPDDFTLVIRLKQPWPQIIYMLAHLPTAPMAKEAVEYYGRDIINHPVGTGPYMLGRWHRGSFIELVRNPNWRGQLYPSEGEPNDFPDGFLADAGRAVPFADRLISVLIEEDPPSWFLFLQGKIDASGIPKDNFSQAIDQRRQLTDDMKRRGIRLYTFRDPSTYWIGFNMEDPVLANNKPLRKAISYAVDRDKYIELFTNNRGETAYGIIPPLMKDYDPNISKIGAHYDVARARQYAEEAKKLNGGVMPKLKFAMPGTDVVFRQRGDFLIKCFRDAGLNIEIDYMDWPTFLDKIKTKSAQMFGLGWVADIPDSENFLQLFYSRNISPGPNNFNYSSPEFDKIYEQLRVMQDCPERTELYRKAERIVIEDAPAVFILHGVAYILTHDWLYNYKPHAFAYGLSKYRRVDTEKREKYRKRFKDF